MDKVERLNYLEQRAEAIQLREVLPLRLKEFWLRANELEILEDRLIKLESPKLRLIRGGA